MDKSYIVSGTFFGDEGKGSIIDYLSYQKGIKENVRYNGGSQASHTVIANNIKHKFSQLGSVALNDGKTYLSEYTVVNPFNLYKEAEVFSSESKKDIREILDRIYISKYSRVVTPYHKLLGQLRELSSLDRRGSVGTGVSETTKTFEETGLEITINDLLQMNINIKEKLRELRSYLIMFMNQNVGKIDSALLKKYIDPMDLYYLTQIDKDYLFNCYLNLMNGVSFNTVDNIRKFHECGDLLFEGSQGVLIDRNHGIRPNTTLLDTTNKNAIVLASTLDTKIIKIGAITPFTSRHGKGLLPTQDEMLCKTIYDENQLPSYYQGVPRYGWFDLVLARYSNEINQNDEMFMTQIDRLSSFQKIKICTEYIYEGIITEEFDEIFDYYSESGKVIITRIKKNTINLKKYLSLCTPKYIEVKGWNCDISNIKNYEELPNECIRFIELIESLLDTKITYVGIGETRNQKLERKLK